jgi:two-component system OmpR family response regulator
MAPSGCLEAAVRLLVVDGNAGLRQLLAGLFAAAGHDVEAAGSVADMEMALASGRFDLILLDLAMAHGVAMLRALRERGVATPILSGTVGADAEVRIAALEAGADMVMAKPFASDELLARVRALLRRPPTLPTRTLWLGNIALDPDAPAVRVNGGTVALTRGDIAVLETLMRHGARPVARQTLEAAIHSLTAELTGNAIEAAVSRVRRRLDSAGARVTITATRGLGYRITERTG